jgi:hypothetical protein
MARACEWLAKLSGWTAGACLVLALMSVTGEVRADEFEGYCDEECPALSESPTPEELAAYEACIENCLTSACSSPNTVTCTDNSTTNPTDCNSATKGVVCDTADSNCKCRFSRVQVTCSCGY